MRAGMGWLGPATLGWPIDDQGLVSDWPHTHLTSARTRGNHARAGPSWVDGALLPTSRPVLLLIAGLSATLLTVALPLAHLRVRPSGLALGLLALPFLVLLVTAARPNARWLTHFVFPASHLPLLVVQPELTSREVYGGLSGLVGLIAIAIAYTLFLAAATPSIRRRTPPHHTPRRAWTAHPDVWRTLAILFAVGPMLALALPSLTAVEPDPLGAAVAVGSGVAVAFVAVGWWMPRLVLIRPEARAAALTTLARQSRPSGSRTTWALVVAALFLIGIAVWSIWRP